MKTDEIDKKIGMPDVNAEWERFQREVISGESRTIVSTPNKRVSMLKKVAAVVLIVLGFSGAVLAAVHLQKSEDDKELVIDKSGETKPLVTFRDQISPNRRNVYVVSLCPGTWVKNSDGKEHIEEEFQHYYFFAPKGTLTMMLDGKPFDKNSLPKLTNKDLKKIESTANGDNLAVNLITKEMKVPAHIMGNLPRVMTILLPGKGDIYFTKNKAQEGNWMNSSIGSWAETDYGWSMAQEFEKSQQRVPGFKAYIYSSTETTQKDIDRATALLKEVGVTNITYRKDLPVKHFTNAELRQWAQDQKDKGLPYDDLYNKMAPLGMPVEDVRAQWHIVKSVYGIKK
ncbi:MAG: hypothetical protein KBT29_00375 [Prevotellaceae bacterium]|nr:hypothetical protein [Candidatus Minthosoma caballi]